MYVVKNSRWRLSDKSTKISHNFPCCFASPSRSFPAPRNLVIYFLYYEVILLPERRRRRWNAEKYWIYHWTWLEVLRKWNFVFSWTKAKCFENYSKIIVFWKFLSWEIGLTDGLWSVCSASRCFFTSFFANISVVSKLQMFDLNQCKVIKLVCVCMCDMIQSPNDTWCWLSHQNFHSNSIDNDWSVNFCRIKVSWENTIAVYYGLLSNVFIQGL